MNELGAELLVQPPSLSATVSRMVRMGLVTRRGAEDDHRGRRIGLTDAGRERLARAVPEHQEWVSSMLSGLSESERDELGVLLDKLAEHLSLLASGPERPRDVSRRAGKQRTRSSRVANRRIS